MKFTDIDTKRQNIIVDELNNHLVASHSILKKDKCILPLLIIKGENPNENKLISLQPASGQMDVDAAFESAIETLKASEFKIAIFSYSTKMSFDGKEYIDAIKSVIIFNDGLSAIIFSPYVIKGFINKKVYIGKSTMEQVIENIFQ